MSERNQYFRKFPITVYRGQLALNILKRVDFNSNVKDFLTSFYAHTMSTDDRIENIAHDYYNDVDLDWILYHANDIIDPRYDVPLSYNTFDDYLLKKYGSIRETKRKVIHYKNNYQGDDQIISVSSYQALSSNVRKYYQPIMSAIGIAGYERAEIDYIASTNKIMSANISSITGAFVKDEVVYKNSDTTTIAQVSWSSNTAINIQHVQGQFLSESNYTLTGETSGAVATINATSVEVLFNVIPEEEQIFYKPITIYDDEESKNELKRQIYLVDSGYIPKLNKQLTDIMK